MVKYAAGYECGLTPRAIVSPSARTDRHRARGADLKYDADKPCRHMRRTMPPRELHNEKAGERCHSRPLSNQLLPRWSCSASC
jgi:hypothetical protein